MIAERGESTADLAVAAFHESDDVLFAVANDCKFGGAVIEHDAVVGNHLLVEGLQRLVEFYFVDFGLAKFGVGHLEGEIAIIGEENQAGGIFVEATDGLEVLVFCWQQFVESGGGPLSAAGADIADRLVKGKINVVGGEGDWLIITTYL